MAKRLGLDETFVFEDAQDGWKISRFVPDCIPFDYRNEVHVAKALQIARCLHESGETSPWSFDFYEEARKIVSLLRRADYPLPQDFETLLVLIDAIADFVAAESGPKVLCHNDLYGPNFLINDEAFYLIDWEYSAMSDYGCDIGNFIAQGSGYSVEEAIEVLDKYFRRCPTEEEIRHCLACTAIVGFYWYIWAVYKESQGNPVGEWIYVWYRAAKTFGNYVLPLYEKGM